jgi:hypothetical protein
VLGQHAYFRRIRPLGDNDPVVLNGVIGHEIMLPNKSARGQPETQPRTQP